MDTDWFHHPSALEFEWLSECISGSQLKCYKPLVQHCLQRKWPPCNCSDHRSMGRIQAQPLHSSSWSCGEAYKPWNAMKCLSLNESLAAWLPLDKSGTVASSNIFSAFPEHVAYSDASTWSTNSGGMPLWSMGPWVWAPDVTCLNSWPPLKAFTVMFLPLCHASNIIYASAFKRSTLKRRMVSLDLMIQHDETVTISEDFLL